MFSFYPVLPQPHHGPLADMDPFAPAVLVSNIRDRGECRTALGGVTETGTASRVACASGAPTRGVASRSRPSSWR